MSKTNCEDCNRNFENEEALEMHNKAKHDSSSNKKKEGKPPNTKKIRNWTVFIIILGFIIALIAWTVNSAVNESEECLTASAKDLNIRTHSGIASHIHPQLQIIIDGQQQSIPTEIGIDTGVMLAVHTHDGTGELHVEPPCVRTFQLKDFFEVWEKTFNSQCIFEHCTDSGELTMTVNGALNNEFENLVLRDDDQIVIEYNSF